MPDTPTETVWRCSECGKWSHAKRRPSWHERNVQAQPDDDDPDASLIVRVLTEFELGSEFLWGWVVKCGPFDEYRAEKVTKRV